MTAEGHSIFGGLGEDCAAILMEARMIVPFKNHWYSRQIHSHWDSNGHLLTSEYDCPWTCFSHSNSVKIDGIFNLTRGLFMVHNIFGI
jgi:hypothetical protein